MDWININKYFYKYYILSIANYWLLVTYVVEFLIVGKLNEYIKYDF
ncbi:hypothetical protein ABG998_06835 [Clostridium tertium]|nr:hypothetical protein [Clostridium sp.]MDU2157131.1 hypothetical protein [Clostridium sp.]